MGDYLQKDGLRCEPCYPLRRDVHEDANCADCETRPANRQMGHSTVPRVPRFSPMQKSDALASQ